MPQSINIATENNFSNGYKTEYTALNFPENSTTNSSNVMYSRIGNVLRRPGLDYETNFHLNTINRDSLALSSYVWKNVGGDGLTVLWVQQIGSTLHFFSSTAATTASPISNHKLSSTVDLTAFTASGGSFDTTAECQFADGNGILFVFHPSMDPIYCTYNAGTITGNLITMQIRDFSGVIDNFSYNFRPPALSSDHKYNLQNQGWTIGGGWTATSTTAQTVPLTVSSTVTWTVQTGLTIAGGQSVNIATDKANLYGTGTVSTYNAGTGALALVINTWNGGAGGTKNSWTFTQANTSTITTWNTSQGNFPSNADVWWVFKDSTGIFSSATLATTVPNTTLPFAPAPRGSYILNLFGQDRSSVSSVSGITLISTTARPSTGAFHNQRVWYTGIKASQQASGDVGYYTWTEAIYFSQTIDAQFSNQVQYGMCYQVNDPTDERLFDLLPTDGGVIFIQGSGNIYKLVPIENGILVFAANGVWFITGSKGIGFTADDYTITKISAVRSISSTSFVDVLGYPIWWNEEGIYMVVASAAGLQVEPISFTTIQSFYQNIPYDSLRFARGAYNPLTWEVRWIYKSTQETNVNTRYAFDSVLLFNTITKSFSPWSISNSGTSPFVHGINFIQNPGGSTAPPAAINYIASVASGSTYNFTFAGENNDSTWTDWPATGSPINFSSSFTTGYKLHGKGLTRMQTNWLVFYVNNYSNMQYNVQGVWDFATDPNTGKFTNPQKTAVTLSTSQYAVAMNRHKINGRGRVYQFQVSSEDNQPFDIIGWAIEERINAGS